MPTPKGLPILGTSLELLVNSRGGQKLHEYVDWRHKQLGPIFKECLGPIIPVFLSDAEEIRKVFANEGKCPRHVLPDCWLLYNKMKNYKRGLYFMWVIPPKFSLRLSFSKMGILYFPQSTSSNFCTNLRKIFHNFQVSDVVLPNICHIALEFSLNRTKLGETLHNLLSDFSHGHPKYLPYNF